MCEGWRRQYGNITAVPLADSTPRCRWLLQQGEAQTLIDVADQAQVKKDGVTDLVVLPLYPQFSISTSGSSLRLLQQMFEADPELDGLRHSVIASWCAP